jgi:hypothetical protein
VSFSPLASEKYERFSSFTPAIVKVLGVFPPLATTAWRARTFIYNITVAVVFMCINIHRPLVVRLTDRSGALDVIASQVAVSKVSGLLTSPLANYTKRPCCLTAAGWC